MSESGTEWSRQSLVFVHLSDLHFRDHGSHLAEREAALRDLLLEDIPKTVARVDGGVEAVLLTGDLARAGQRSEYIAARLWLDELCRRIGIHETKTLTVPGNHDVDWTSLNSDPGRVAINLDLRSCEERLIDEKIDRLLQTPDVVLRPLENYQEFAAAYACDINNCLAWDLPPIPFGGGYSLAIRGGNSVINSDWSDAERTMAVQTNQLLVRREPGLVRMLMIHHSPHFWRRPNPSPAKCRHNIVLYGHTHQPEHNMVGNACLEITAGALHPEESEFAIPGYNVIEVSIEEPADADGAIAFARIRVFHREFCRDEQEFIDTKEQPSINEVVEIVRAGAEERGDVAPHGETSENDVAEREAPEARDVMGDAETQPPLQSASGVPDPLRVVRAAFERLGSGQRLRVLDRVHIPRARIIDLPPHRQISEVASIVVESASVEAFLNAVTEIGS